MQGSLNVEDQIEVVDLTAEPEPSKPRFGGRFWVLADEEDNDPKDQPQVVCLEEKPGLLPAMPCSASPLQSDSGERRKNAVAFGPRPPSSAPEIKPWIGPVPKVSSSTITLSDFL